MNYNLIKRLRLRQKQIEEAVRQAKEEEKIYRNKFRPDLKKISEKTVIVVDDGVATGASVIAVSKSVRRAHADKIYLAVPVAPEDFDQEEDIKRNDGYGFDRAFILKKDPGFRSVGQYYSNFDQVSDAEVLEYFKKR